MNESNIHQKYFGEFVRYDKGEKEEVKTYLESWKKFLVRKLQRDSYNVKIIDEQWIERGPEYDTAFKQMSFMGLKLCIEADWHYELGKS